MGQLRCRDDEFGRKLLAQGERQIGHPRHIGRPTAVDPLGNLMRAERGLAARLEGVLEDRTFQSSQIGTRCCGGIYHVCNHLPGFAILTRKQPADGSPYVH